jgi:signal transduction histidine kinase
MMCVGLAVTRLIEDNVTRHAGATAALYVDSVIAPLLPDMQRNEMLDVGIAQALDETLEQGALGERLLSFRLWRSDGTILYANDRSLVGQRFPISSSLQTAFSGEMVAEFGPADDVESRSERESRLPLLEIYNPVLQPWSGNVVAVLEFYEIATELQHDLRFALIRTWLVVAGVILCFFLALSAIVIRGSKTIDQQRSALQDRIRDLSEALHHNRELRDRVQKASQRAVAYNERYLRRIGADLHDGPAQLVAFASLRLDSDLMVGNSTPEQRDLEVTRIRASLDEAMAELRNICRGLVLPHIESAALSEILRTLVQAYEQRSGKTVSLTLSQPVPQLSPSEKICVFRFVQEALNNGFRHADGRGQRVIQTWSGETFSVAVADAGGGFDTELVPPNGIGLVGLRERVESLGGLFEVSSSARGTTVQMSFERSFLAEDTVL